MTRSGQRSFCIVRTPIFSTPTWRPKPPFWPDSWAVCSKPAALPRFRGKNTGEPRSWRKSRRRSTPHPQSAAVVEAVADRLRVLLRTRLVCMMLREGTGFSLNAVAAESPQLAASVRARHDRRGLQFAADLASRAVAAGEPISVAIDPATHALGELVPPGMLIAAPFRTSAHAGRSSDLSAARGDFQRGGKIADFGGHRLCGGRHRQRGTLQHGPGPGPRTPPVAGYLGRTRLHRPVGRVSAAVCIAGGGLPGLWTRLHRAAGKRLFPRALGGRKRPERSRWISCFPPDPPARPCSTKKFSGRTSPAKSPGRTRKS